MTAARYVTEQSDRGDGLTGAAVPASGGVLVQLVPALAIERVAFLSGRSVPGAGFDPARSLARVTEQAQR